MSCNITLDGCDDVQAYNVMQPSKKVRARFGEINTFKMFVVCVKNVNVSSQIKTEEFYMSVSQSYNFYPRSYLNPGTCMMTKQSINHVSLKKQSL